MRTSLDCTPCSSEVARANTCPCCPAICQNQLPLRRDRVDVSEFQDFGGRSILVYSVYLVESSENGNESVRQPIVVII